MGQAAGQRLKFVDEMALVIISEQLSQLVPFQIHVGFHKTDNPLKSDKT